MTDNDSVNLAGFAECVDKIEAACEYMLAYAAQGRDRESAAGGAGPSIRSFLADLEFGLQHITSASRMTMAELQAGVDALQALESFSDQLEHDAERALTVLRTVMTAPTISSQLIDNLNASVHLRCLLSDIFVVDETIRIHLRAGLSRPA